MAIEYVRKRRVVRLLGWIGDAPIAPVEFPVDQLCPGLGISPHDLGAQLAWFGLHPAGSGDDDAPLAKPRPLVRRPLVRRRVSGEASSYLRAVMPS